MESLRDSEKKNLIIYKYATPKGVGIVVTSVSTNTYSLREWEKNIINPVWDLMLVAKETHFLLIPFGI